MAVINKFKTTNQGNSYDISVSDDRIAVEQNGNLFGDIRFSEAGIKELKAFKAGMGYGLILEKNFVKADGQVNQNVESTTNQETGYFSPNTSTPAKQKVLTPNSGKPNIYPTVSNDIDRLSSSTIGYSDTSIPNGMNGFTDKIIIALLSGVGIGIVTTIIYIFINLGKVSITM